MLRARSLVLALVLPLFACLAPSAQPVTEPQPSSSAAPAASSAASAPAPADPLAGLDEAARWTWAIERMPALAELATAPTGTLDLLVADGGKVTLHSPELPEHSLGMFPTKPCAPVTFARKGDVLATRMPMKGGAARPDVRNDYVVLELAAALSVGPVVTSGIGVGGLASQPPPQRSAVLRDVLRYQGRTQQYGVECSFRVETRRCGDGSETTCRTCEPVLFEVPRDGGTGSIGMAKAGCEPCPPEGEEIAEALDRVVEGRRFLATDPRTGASFYRTKKACLAARTEVAPAPAVAPVDAPPCPPARRHPNGSCCPLGTRAGFGDEGEACVSACPAGTTPVGGGCCPAGTNAMHDAGTCCPPGKVVWPAKGRSKGGEGKCTAPVQPTPLPL